MKEKEKREIVNRLLGHGKDYVAHVKVLPLPINSKCVAALIRKGDMLWRGRGLDGMIHFGILSECITHVRVSDIILTDLPEYPNTEMVVVSIAHRYERI